MAFQYDEDLSQNKFFQKLQSEHKILIDTAPLENWIICVPRLATIQPENLTDTDYLLAHILIPHDEISEQYTNLLGIDIKLINGKLCTPNTSANILFEEIFYTKGLVKYKVWCIESSLLFKHGTTVSPTAEPSNIFIVRGLQDAIALIWNETSSKAVFRKIESICCSFMKNTSYSLVGSYSASNANDNSDNRENNFKRIKSSMEILLNHCFKKLMYQRRLGEKCSRDPHFQRVFKIAVETYIMDILYRWLFDTITICYAEESEKFNKVLRNLADTNARHFKIDNKYNNVIGRVRVELLKIVDFTTPIEQISCLRRAVTAASQCKHNDISVDDLIPILVFVIVKSGLTHWITLLNYLKHFIFTGFSDGSEKGVDSFLITTLEAAILYIQTIDLNEFRVSSNNALERTKNKRNEERPRKFSTKENFVEYLFANIICEDEVEVIKLLKTDKNLEITNEDDDEVDSVLIGGHNDDLFMKSFTVNDDDIDEGVSDEMDVISKFPVCRLNLQNKHGIGAIHVAAMHGLPKMLNLLLALGVNPKIVDENNYTPLHYAAARGHQNTLLLLIHAGAEINAFTNDRNTPLHLSSLNGHSNCVKALLYYSDHMKVKIEKNIQNKMGDTALHLAAKWGFSEIVETLLEYGVKTDLSNRLGQTPLNVAHNSRIASQLQDAFVMIDTSESGIWDASSTDNEILTNSDAQVFRGCYFSSTTSLVDEIGSDTLLQKSVNDKIVAAIRNGDIKLAYHFLGIEAPEEITSSVCHPLCDCDKCKHIVLQLALHEKSDNQLTQKYDGDINACSTDGMTPLHAAVQEKNSDLIEKLIQMGATVQIQSKHTKQTAIHYAVLIRDIKILDNILEHIVDASKPNDIDVQDSNGDTALHIAVKLGDTQLVECLLKHEPNLHWINCDGKTPLDIAKSLFYLNIVRLLELAENN